MEALTLANGTNTVVLGAKAKAAGIVTVNGGSGADAVTLHDGVTTYKPTEGADNVTVPLLQIDSSLTIDTTSTTTDFIVDLTTFQDSAASWIVALTLAATNQVNEVFYASDVLHVYNENRITGGAGITKIATAGIVAITSGTANGEINIDVV